MTNLPPPPGEFPPPVSDEAWELASAYLDNEVTPDERAHVEASPLLLSLVAQLQPNRDTLQAVAVPSAATREAAVAKALQTLDAPEAGTAASPPAISLDQVRAKRASRPNRWLAPLAAAAGIAVVVGLGATVLGKGSETKTASRTDSASSVAAAPATTVAAAATTKASGQATTTAAPDQANAPTTGAPAFTSVDSTVITTAKATPTTTARPTTAAATSVPPRPVQVDVALTAGELDELRRLVNNSQPFLPEACSAPADAPLAIATLLWRGEQATAFTDEGRTIVVVVSDAACVRSATASL
jgi:hypothetical protein